MSDTTVDQDVSPPPEKAAEFEKLTGYYVQLRDKLKELNDEHEKKIAPLVETQNLITAKLMASLEGAGAQSIKTSRGTVYQSTRYTASLADPQAFMNYVISNNKFDLLDRKANATAVKDFVAETGSLPPGAKLSAVRTIGVRRAPGK